MARISHALFDCDDVIVYSERLNFIAWREALEFYFHNADKLREQSHKIILGKPLAEIFRIFENLVGSDITPTEREKIIRKKYDFYVGLARKELKAEKIGAFQG